MAKTIEEVKAQRWAAMKIKIEAIMADRSKGLPFSHTARRFGVTPQYIRVIFEREKRRADPHWAYSS
jgi:hypothetical protein